MIKKKKSHRVRVSKDIPNWNYAVCSGKPKIGDKGKINNNESSPDGKTCITFRARDLGYSSDKNMNLYIPNDCFETI